MRTVLLGLLGLVLAVAVGFGVHLITRGTISLPVVRLEPAPALAPPAATTTNARRPSGQTRRRDRHRPDERVDPTGDDGSGAGTGQRRLTLRQQHGRSGDDD